MPRIGADPHRLDPYKNFKFRIKWDGREVAGLSKMSILRPTSEVAKNCDGRDPGKGRRSRSRTKFEAITLERGVTYDAEFERWANACNPNASLGSGIFLKNLRKDLLIEVYNEIDQIVRAYRVYRCWVSEFQSLPDLDASANAVAIEHIKIENEGWERDTGVTEPNEHPL